MFKLLLVALCSISSLFASLKVGVDVFFDESIDQKMLQGKRVGLVTNHTAINCDFLTTLDLFKQANRGYKLTAIFSPEHGLYGDLHAEKNVADSSIDGVPIYSLHGKRRRPTLEMLKKIDVLVYDIQDIGSRSYTYISTLFYCMEECAKLGLKCIVLDRPNPLGGIVDGPMLEEKWRSFVGYVNIPYCHGMSVGELAHFFNEEYNVHADLTVIAMKGWKREMIFRETGLVWIPTSPQIPEEDTAFFYPTTGIIGQLSIVSIGVGYTLPFKIVGAPWIDSEIFADKLNKLHLPGVTFCSFYFRPFFGKFKSENCQGVKIVITDPKTYLPFTTQYALLGILKTLYPKEFKVAMETCSSSSANCDMFNKLNGNDEMLTILRNDNYFIWKMRDRFQKERELFLQKRKKYLNATYS